MSKLFSPACEQVLGALRAPAELRRRKEFFHFVWRCRKVVREPILSRPLPNRGPVQSKGLISELPQALAEDLRRKRDLSRHFGRERSFSISFGDTGR